jgi:hypothetical protein
VPNVVSRHSHSQQAQAYARLSLDNDKKVREAIYVAFAPLALGVKKALASHIKTLMPAWWMHQHDSFRDVARVAKEVFEQVRR